MGNNNKTTDLQDTDDVPGKLHLISSFQCYHAGIDISQMKTQLSLCVSYPVLRS